MILRVRVTAAHKSWLSVCHELIFPLGLRNGVRSISSTEGQQNTRSSSGFRNIEVMDVDRVRVIGLNRPRQRNSVNRQTARELYGAFRLFDEEIVRMWLFCMGREERSVHAGYDLKELASASTKNGGMDLNCCWNWCWTHGNSISNLLAAS